MDKKAKENIFDAFIRSAIQEDIESNDLNKEIPDDETEHIFSDAFEKKMKKLIKEQRRQAGRAKRKHMMRRIGGMAAGIVLIGGILVTNVDAFRVPISNFFLDIKDQYTDIVLSRQIHYDISDELQRYMPQYMPEGFVITNVVEQTNEVHITCENDGGEFYVLDFWMTAQNTSADTENTVWKKENIQGIPAMIIQKDDRTYITWMPNEHEYYLAGQLTKEEGIRILESVQVDLQ